MNNRLRFSILERDSFTCQYCGRKPPEVQLHVDHRFPVSKGGQDDPANLYTACTDCNYGKATSLIIDRTFFPTKRSRFLCEALIREAFGNHECGDLNECDVEFFNMLHPKHLLQMIRDAREWCNTRVEGSTRPDMLSRLRAIAIGQFGELIEEGEDWTTKAKTPAVLRLPYPPYEPTL